MKEQFTPLCDLHHTAMQPMTLESVSKANSNPESEEAAEEGRSFHACGRRDCTRVFRAGIGYSDRMDGVFDDDRANVRPCPTCGSPLYLSSANRVYKVETWECLQDGCEFREEASAPSGR